MAASASTTYLAVQVLEDGLVGRRLRVGQGAPPPHGRQRRGSSSGGGAGGEGASR